MSEGANKSAGFLVWDPDRVACTIPGIDHPIAWYGVLFACGLLLAYYLFTRALVTYLRDHYPDRPELVPEAKQWSQTFAFYVGIALVAGARLGHFIFYEPWGLFLKAPWTLFKLWEGGLASHGALVGAAVGVVIFMRRGTQADPPLTWRACADLLMVPALVLGGLIRIGNFINQEVIGKVTDLPWAVVLVHPLGGEPFRPRHPVQLYEALFYGIGALLYGLWFARYLKRVGRAAGEGRGFGLCLLVTFLFRIGIEFFKESQSSFVTQGAWLNMGQRLSIPFVVLGLILVVGKQGGLKRLLGRGKTGEEL